MTERSYLDFDVLIEPAPGGGFRARVVDSPSGQASHVFELPFAPLELENFVLKLSRTRSGVRRLDSPEMETARTFGGRLYKALFDEDVGQVLRRSLDEAERQGQGLRLKLRLGDVPDLANLPWEYLYNERGDRFLVLSAWTPIVRFVDLAQPVAPLQMSPPLRILVMISSPSDYEGLDVESEWSRLSATLDGLVEAGRVHIDRIDDASLLELQRTLRQNSYHVFHFIGHGGFDQRAEDGVLMLEDADGRAKIVPGRNLGTILHDHRSLRLAVLNACEGARTSTDDPFAGVAQSLVRQGVPAVVAMQFEITDTAAITFSSEFYQAISEGLPVDASLAEARRAIFGLGNDVEWGTPVLYMRTPDGRIFDMDEADVPPAPDSVPPAAPPVPMPVVSDSPDVVSTEPEAVEPEPVAPEPEPVAPEPVAPEPVAPEPVAPEPVAAVPPEVTTEPATSSPERAVPDEAGLDEPTPQPETAPPPEPEPAQPEVAAPRPRPEPIAPAPTPPAPAPKPSLWQRLSDGQKLATKVGSGVVATVAAVGTLVSVFGGGADEPGPTTLPPTTIATTITATTAPVTTVPVEPRFLDTPDVVAERVTSPPTIDGDLAEWVESDRYRADETFFLNPNISLSDRLGESNQSQFVLGWDVTGLYVGTIVTDDVRGQSNNGDQIWRGDAVNVNLTLAAPVTDPLALADTSDFQVTMSPGDPASQAAIGSAVFQGTGSGFVNAVVGTVTVAAIDTEEGYTLEAFVPWSALDSSFSPSSGDQLGLLLSVFDNDGENDGSLQTAITANVTCESSEPRHCLQRPGTWGTLTLAP